MTTTSFIIPFKTDHGPREKAFHWIKKYYKTVIKDAEVCVGTCHTKPFSKSKAVNNAAEKASGNILIIVDADIICSPALISKAIQLLHDHAWIIPYTQVKNVTTTSTKKLLQTSPFWPLPAAVETQTVYKEKILPVGGINIIPKTCFKKVGGFDERFYGWGGEDDAFACSVDTLCGSHKRLQASIYHLWHPKVYAQKNPHYKENVKLASKYCHSYGDKRTMQQIIDRKL